MSGLTWGKGRNKSKGSIKGGNPHPGYASPQLAALAKENARRVRCGQCELMILPENMERHRRLCHDWDDEPEESETPQADHMATPDLQQVLADALASPPPERIG